jgi:hypothetical protein
MDLKTADTRTATATPLSAGIDHAELENDGPTAHGDRLGTPAADEAVWWKGRPSLGMLARTAFHTRTLGLYMAALSAIAVILGNYNAAMVAAGLGVALVARHEVILLRDDVGLDQRGAAVVTPHDPAFLELVEGAPHRRERAAEAAVPAGIAATKLLLTS